MQQLNTFFRTLINSLSNPKYYADVLKVKAWFSWKYFLFWNVLASLVVLMYVLPPVIAFKPSEATHEIVTVYPEELEIYGSERGITINQERPYRIPFPKKWMYGVSEADKENININDVPLDEAESLALVTFDTDANIQNIQDFYESESLAVLTESTIYMLDDADTGEVRVYEIPAFEEEFSFGFSKLKGFENKVLNHPFVSQKWYIPLLGLFLVLVMIPVTIWLRIVTIAIYSVLVWITAGFVIKKTKIEYGKAFQVGLHTLTLPVLIKIIVDLVNTYSSTTIQFGGIWFFLVYFVWTMYVLYQAAATTKVATKKAVAKKATTSTKTKTKAKTTKKSVTKKSTKKTKK
jgi:hypothetical protein